MDIHRFLIAVFYRPHGRSIRIRSLLLLLVLLLAFPFSSWAQDELHVPQQLMPGEAPSLRFENIGLEDGLSQGTVYDIMQDKEGYIWLTTQDGLHRYDGYEFKVFTSIPFDSTSLSSSFVRSISEGSNGYLWVTTERGLDRMDKTTGKAKHYAYDPADSTSLSSNFTFDVLQSKNGDLWVSTNKGLNVMSPGRNGHFDHYRHDPEDPNSLSSDDLNWINEDNDGNIWVGSMNGLNRIDTKTGKVSRFLYDPEELRQIGSLPSTILNVYLPPDESNIAWLATGMGLVRLDTQTGEHERFVIDPDGPADNRTNTIYKVTPDPSTSGILWLSGPATGIVRFDITNREFTSYKHDPRDPRSLADNSIWDLFTDRAGKLWVGHEGHGLSNFNPGAVNFSHLRNDPNNLSSLAPGIVWGIYEDRARTLWVGSNYPSEGNFVTQLDANTGSIKRHQYDPNNPASLSGGIYSTFAEDNSGQFWVGGAFGLNRLDRETGQVRRYIHLPREENFYRNAINAILPMAKDSGQMWIGSVAGLELFNTKTGQYKPYELSPGRKEQNMAVQALFHSRDGNLWIGTMEGLFQINSSGEARLASAYDSNDRKTLSNNTIASIYERREEPGVLWLATIGGGLNRFDTKTGTAKHYMQEEGLPNNVVYGILEDDNGTLWMSTNHGISNFDPDEEIFRNYSLDDGLIELEYAQNAFAKGADGMMYFGHLKGVTAFHPDKLAVNQTPPQMLLSGMKLFNKPVTPGPDSPLKEPLSETERVTLKFSQKEIAFDYVALHYGNSAKNSYAYMLEGFDEDWIDAGTRRSASYNNLEPGNYTFRVKAANADGIWNNEGASVELTILPPWYRTWWAYVLFAVLLVGSIVGINKFQRRRHRKEEQKRAALREAELRAEAENKRNADTEQLSKIGRAITSTLSITKVIDIVYGHVNQLMDAAIFGVGIYNKEKDRLEFPAAKEEGIMLPPYFHKLTEENRLAVLCFNSKKEIIIGDFQRERKNYITNYLPPVKGRSTRSIIYLPLVHQDKTIGVITTQSFKENVYTPYHIELFRNLATYAAIAIDNASAYKQLNETFTELKATQEHLVQQEKLASLGQLTAGIAHEIKNPLNFVNNFSELSVEMVEEAREEIARITPDNPKDRESLFAISGLLNDIKTNLKRIVKHGTRADGIVRSMLQHSRGGTGKLNPVDINALIREYVNLTFHAMRAGKHPINVEIDLQLDEQTGEVSLIEEDFSRVIINICNNAFDAMREKLKGPSVNGNYLPKLSVKSSRQDGLVSVIFEDNGPGIPSSFRNQILQPFFTTKKGNQGTGLGLSITNDIIKSHRGTLDIYSEEGAYSRFVIQIPHEQNQVIL